jgi:hypothetical protein
MLPVFFILTFWAKQLSIAIDENTSVGIGMYSTIMNPTFRVKMGYGFFINSGC